MKKFWCAFLWTVFLSLLMAGCGGGRGDDPLTTNSVNHLTVADQQFLKEHPEKCLYGCGWSIYWSSTSIGIGTAANSGMTSGMEFHNIEMDIAGGGFAGDYSGGVMDQGNVDMAMTASPDLGPQTNLTMQWDDLGRALVIYTDPAGAIIRSDVYQPGALPTNSATGRVYIPVKRRYWDM